MGSSQMEPPLPQRAMSLAVMASAMRISRMERWGCLLFSYLRRGRHGHRNSVDAPSTVTRPPTSCVLARRDKTGLVLSWFLCFLTKSSCVLTGIIGKREQRILLPIIRHFSRFLATGFL